VEVVQEMATMDPGDSMEMLVTKKTLSDANIVVLAMMMESMTTDDYYVFC
jgi:hypothetical protein